MNEPPASFDAKRGTEGSQPSLSDERRRLLELRLKGAARPPAQTPSIPHREAGQPAPLSAAQHQMWLIEQMNPGIAAHNIPVAFRLGGILDTAVLEEGFNQIIQRHESWRTTFGTRDGDSFQQVHAKCRIRISHEDFTRLPPEQCEDAARSRAAAEGVTPFDLGCLPLLRVSLLKLAEEDHILLVVVHHIVADGLSLSLIFDELDAFHRDAKRGGAVQLPELRAQYADFAAWQAQELSAERNSEQIRHWQQVLSGELPALELPADHPRPPRQSFAGSHISFAIARDIAQSLRAIAARERCTFFTVAFAAFHVLLMRHSNNAQILIGTPVARRPLPEFEPLIGNFLNVVTLRGDASGDPAFTEFLARCRETALDALANTDVPFEAVVKSLRAHRDPGRNPIFQALMQVLPPFRARLGDLRVSRFDFEMRFSQADIALHLFEEHDGSYLGHLQFCTALFERETIVRLASAFTWLLGGIVENPGTPISRLPILGEAERARIVGEWSGAERPYPDSQTIAERFTECAAKTPDVIAITDGDARLTFAELDARSNGVANFLQSRGIRNGDFVGLRAERTASFVVQALGIAKAGGAYVPLDENEPPARLAAMRASCATVLDAEPGGDFSAQSTATDARADGAAYVLFTSGSTGAPKGVVVPHCGIMRLVVNNDYAPFRTDDVVAFASNVCFDAATFEIWGALLNGARLVVTPREVLLSPDTLARHIAQHRISVMFLTTSLFNRLAQESPAMFAGLRILVFGGEAADAASVRLVLEHGKPQRLVNGYGPTETTTFAVCHTIEKVAGATVPIGRPIANTRVFILDRAMQPVPQCVAGELFIGGPGVALGYHGAPELTAERFLPTEFGRLYRTGDLARWLADGTIEYLGRLDAQVKIRGFRIEPGEIESALQSHPGVRQAVVIARTESGRAQALIAYVVPQPDARAEDSALREFLSQRLPAYMVPSAFVQMDSLPLTPNGKLDARKLPVPESGGGSTRQSGDPHTDLEIRIAAVWRDVLKIERVGIHDDFFELGGDSLRAMQVASRLRGPQFPALNAFHIFERPTVADFAASLESAHATEAREEGVL